jgi:hypothetical protein
MLSCMVDGQAHEITVCESVVLADIIGTLNSELAKDGRFIASLMVDGEKVEAGSEGSTDRALAQVSRLDVTTESSENPAREVLAEGCGYLGELHLFLLQTTKLYRSGDETKGREHFMELINGLEWFVKITSTVERLLNIDFSGTICAGRTLTESVDSFNRILLEIIVAQEQRDVVRLTDLLEYELAPQLELWLEIFTMLRNRDVKGESCRS